MWHYRGQRRPDFAQAPGVGQESVWDYPRPPRLERDPRQVEVRCGDRLLAVSRDAFRVLETASPPTFYVPPGDVTTDLVCAIPGASVCEWKGMARYWGLTGAGAGAGAIAWSYPEPTGPFGPIAGFFAFYPGRVECFLDGERVLPQPGGFYGGWVTREIVGPFKGGPGTAHW
jgi:uncharacterized protein (DUF427 family)